MELNAQKDFKRILININITKESFKFVIDYINKEPLYFTNSTHNKFVKLINKWNYTGEKQNKKFFININYINEELENDIFTMDDNYIYTLWSKYTKLHTELVERITSFDAKYCGKSV